MNILHLASFRGNIGDNASHCGLYCLLDQLGVSANVSKLEIRKYYQNYDAPDKGRFDAAFIDKVNRYDAVLIGGGGFLEYHLPGSLTGTTLDIDTRLLSRIEVPVLMTSLGCDEKQHIPEGNRDRFRRFLEAISINPNLHLMVRNDGSKRYLQGVDQTLASGIPEVLDNGFFYPAPEGRPPFSTDAPYAAINVPLDQLMMQNEDRRDIDLDDFYCNLEQVLRYLVQAKGLNLVLVPHIYRDLEAISELLSRLPDSIVRNHVSVAPCLQGNVGANEMMAVYRDAELVIAGRLHANVCPLVMGKKVIGLSALERVQYLYDSLGLQGSYVFAGDAFCSELVSLVDAALARSGPTLPENKAEYVAYRNATYREFQKVLGGF